MDLKESVPLAGKTTMRIGGTARYFADLASREDIEQAVAFAGEKQLPLIVLGNGSNTVFAEGVIEALVVRLKGETVERVGGHLTVQAGKNLAMLINELAVEGLDLSALTGIPGTIGGAVFGNAGQGPTGVWIDAFVVSVTAYVEGRWKTFTKEECGFHYRESVFKRMSGTPLLWEVVLEVPSGEPAAIKHTINTLLEKRIATQPHLKTAGSCFKAVGDTPAWKLIDAAGLRGVQIGGVQIAEKHANFLLNVGQGTFADARAIVEQVRTSVKDPLDVEMRFIQSDGSLAF